MKSLVVLILFILIQFNSVDNAKSPISLVPYAIKAIIDGHYVKYVQELEIINFGVKNGEGDKAIEKLLKLKNQSMPLKISRNNRDYSNNKKFRLKSSCVLFFDSPESFHRVQKQIIFQDKKKVELNEYIVFIHGAGIETLTPLTQIGYNKVIFPIVKSQKSIDLVTSFLFTSKPKSCWINQFREFNRFTRKQRRWRNPYFFLEKFTDFHGCKVQLQEDNVDFYPLLYKELSKKMNFKIDALEKIDLTKQISFQFQFMAKLDYTDINIRVLHVEQRKLFIPPGELYGDYEKMFLPFDSSTWIAIGVLILFASSAILAMRLVHLTIQKLIFGERTRSPLLNFISILINGSQHGTMIENAPRIVFATFLLWSMIFR
jgi:hypothetical protein